MLDEYDIERFKEFLKLAEKDGTDAIHVRLGSLENLSDSEIGWVPYVVVINPSKMKFV